MLDSKTVPPLVPLVKWCLRWFHSALPLLHLWCPASQYPFTYLQLFVFKKEKDFFEETKKKGKKLISDLEVHNGWKPRDILPNKSTYSSSTSDLLWWEGHGEHCSSNCTEKGDTLTRKINKNIMSLLKDHQICLKSTQIGDKMIEDGDQNQRRPGCEP